MNKLLTALAIAITVSLSGPLYASGDHDSDHSHGLMASNAAATQDAGTQSAAADNDADHPWLTAGGAQLAADDLAAATEALGAQLTDEESVIDVRRDADDKTWAVVLGGFCKSETDCTQYTRELSLDQQDLQAGLSGAQPADMKLNIVPMTLPSVHMANVVIQAQVEPFRGNQSGLAGNDDVKRVQQGLNAVGISTTVDGWYGNGTTSAYATWQRRLGYSGLDATGIPGPSSLTSLGSGRFVVTNKILVGSRTTFAGKRVNTRTSAMLTAAQRLFGRSISLTQGSYNAGGVGASAGTHDGGGAVDINISSLSQTQVWQLVKALRTVGFAAWYRPTSASWNRHVHAIAIGDTDMSLSARNQVADYYVGKDGLAGHRPDNTPAAYRVPFTWWEKY